MLNPLVRAGVKQDPTRILRPGIAVAVATCALLARIGIVNAAHETIAKTMVSHWLAGLMSFVFWTAVVVSAVDRYTDVVERAPEFGLLRILGASKGYLISLVVQETATFAIPGVICGVLLSALTNLVLRVVSGGLIEYSIPLLWWPAVAVLASLGSVAGAIIAMRRAIADGIKEAL